MSLHSKYTWILGTSFLRSSFHRPVPSNHLGEGFSSPASFSFPDTTVQAAVAWLAAGSATKCLLIQRPPRVQLSHIKAHMYFFSRDNGRWIKGKQCREIRFHRAQCASFILCYSVPYFMALSHCPQIVRTDLIWQGKICGVCPHSDSSVQQKQKIRFSWSMEPFTHHSSGDLS